MLYYLKLLSYLQKDLESLHLWSQSNIAFNSAKTTHLRFNTVSCHIPVNLLLNDQEISQSNHQHTLLLFGAHTKLKTSYFLKGFNKKPPGGY